MLTDPPPPETDPAQLAQWQKEADDVEMDYRVKKRRARDRYYFHQGLATGISAVVILAVLVWTVLG